MKCKYCNAEIEQDAQFCTSCGKNLSNLKKSSSSKKWLWVILAIIAIGIGAYYTLNMKNSTALDATETTDIHSEEGIKNVFTETISKGLEMQDSVAVNKFFSKDFKEIYKKVDEYDQYNIPQGEIGFWDFSVWGWGNDAFDRYMIQEVQDITESSALVLVEYQTEQDINLTKFQLLFEDGTWLIDEVTDGLGNSYKKNMKEYLTKAEEEETQQMSAMAERNIYQAKMFTVQGFFNRYIENYGDLDKCVEIVKEFCTEAFVNKYLQNIKGANSIDLAVCGRAHRSIESFGASFDEADLIEENEAQVDFISDSDGRKFSWYVTLDSDSYLIVDIKANKK